MGEVCSDNRFKLIEKYKKKLIEGANIETSPDEMKVLDNILFRMWQMKWLDKLDEDNTIQKMAKEIHEIWYDYFKQDPMDRL